MSSSLGPEIETAISEDYGFKKLGQTAILPSYDEKVPYASLQNLDICNCASLYVACSGGKIVVGKLQQLKDHIQNDSKFDLSFLWERESADVIAVKLIRDEEMIFVNRAGQVFSLDLKQLGDPQEVYAFDQPLVHVKLWRNCTLVALDSQNRLRSYHFANKKLTPLLDRVASFDLAGDQLCVFYQDCSVQNYTMQSSHTMEEGLKFKTPAELLEEIGDEYSALCITALSAHQYELVFGVTVLETEEDVSYDHKIYVVSQSKEQGNKITFQESFDMTPAFGSVLRYPTYYSTALPGILKGGQQRPVNVLTSSCSSEVTIWDSEKVIQPAQDSERAVLPISKVTDNDTNPVGMALDVVTEGSIAQPCSGVDAVDKLPLIYILNNEGSLQIVGVYHSTAIKQGNFSLTALTQVVTSEEIAQEIGQSAVESSGEIQSSDDVEGAQPSLGGLSLGATKSQPESKPFFGGFGQSDSMKPKGSMSGKPFSSDSNPTQQPAFGQPQAFGKPAFGASAGNDSNKVFTFNGSTGNDLGAGLTFGKPAFGQPSFGQPSFGQTTFGSTDKNGSSPVCLPFGKPSFGSSINSGAGFDGSAFGQPLANQGVANVSASPFSKFAADQSKSESPFANLAKNQSENPFTSVTKNQSENPFTSVTKNDNGPAFGVPSFGGSKKTEQSLDKPKFEESPFSRFATSSSTSESPFASLSKAENSPAFDTSPFGNGGTASAGVSTFGDFATSQPKGQSPFASLAKNESSLKFAAPFASGEKDKTEEKPTFGQPASVTPSLREEEYETEEYSKETGESASSDESEGQQDRNQDEESELPVQELDDQNLSGGEIESNATENTPGDGDIKQEQEPNAVNEDENELEESEKKSELKDGAPNEDFSDSTVEQTSTRSGTSISSLTARIKESANIPSDEIKSRTFSQQPVTSEEGQSPFAKFTNDLNKPSSSGFLFSRASDLNKGGKSSKESSADAENPTPKAKPEALKYNFPTAQKDEKSQNSDTPESPVAKDEDSRSESSGEKDKADNDKSSVLNLSDDKKASPTLGSSIEYPETSENSEDHTKDPSPTGWSGTSKEESYDTLDDITAGELESAAVCADASPKGSKAPSKPEKADNEISPEINKRNVQIQASPPPLVNSGTQVVLRVTKNAVCQTDPVPSRDSNIQSFHGDEAHLAVQYKPKPLLDYFSGAALEKVKYHSQNPILKSIEKTYHCVTAELSVLSENISNLARFIDDQSTDHPIERNENSLTNIYTWRIPEANKLHSILNDKSRSLGPQFSSLKSTHEKISKLADEGIRSLQDKVSGVRDEYSKLERLNHDFNGKLGELRYHQFDTRFELRRKMFNVAETIQHIEELLQLLKVHTIQANSMEANPYVVKLVSEAASRENLLHDIASLREDIGNLSLKKERTLYEGGSSAVAQDIQSIEVVEVGLSLNTKKQLGELLKKRKDIEA